MHLLELCQVGQRGGCKSNEYSNLGQRIHVGSGLCNRFVTACTARSKFSGMSDAANVEVAASDDAVPLVPEGDSLVYEEELLRNPYSLKLWLRYLEVRA